MALRMAPELDDRRTCKTCTQAGRVGPCQAVRSGAIVASRAYEPNREQLQRCIAYRPDRTDPDQRPGQQRWPKLNFIFKEKK